MTIIYLLLVALMALFSSVNIYQILNGNIYLSIALLCLSMFAMGWCSAFAAMHIIDRSLNH